VRRAFAVFAPAASKRGVVNSMSYVCQRPGGRLALTAATRLP
jgi:hypothetical protein